MKKEELAYRIGFILLILNVLLILVQVVCTILFNNIIVFWAILLINTIAAVAFSITIIIEENQSNYLSFVLC